MSFLVEGYLLQLFLFTTVSNCGWTLQTRTVPGSVSLPFFPTFFKITSGNEARKFQRFAASLPYQVNFFLVRDPCAHALCQTYNFCIYDNGTAPCQCFTPWNGTSCTEGFSKLPYRVKPDFALSSCLVSLDKYGLIFILKSPLMYNVRWTLEVTLSDKIFSFNS